MNIKNKLLLIGHSDGGTIALIYASEYVDNVYAVITEAAHVMIEERTLQGIKETVSLFQQGSLKRWLNGYHGANTVSMFKSWSDCWLSGQMSKFDITGKLSKITVPVLALQGTDDNYGTSLQPEKIGRNCSGNTEILMIPSCGHVPHIQAKEYVLEKICSFISGFAVNL